jgi:cyclopropane fatty-acyl-phospholipid synthase-like methyltransferase
MRARRARGAAGARQARRPDRYALYEQAVQDPEADVALLRRIFRKHFGRDPRRLREDFCGTAVLARRFVEKHPENEAWAIDLDPVPLAWGREHHREALRPEQRARLHLLQGDVREVRHRPVDVTVAFNFSYFLLRTREELRGYFAKARRTLAREGLFLVDCYGGADSFRTLRERRRVNGFVYVWDQHAVDPISHSVTNFIHFEFRDGSRMRRAFRYDWRLWTLPEIRELLAEAGFSASEVYWEGTDRRTGEANGIFHPRERAPDDPAWICYVAART